MDHHKIIACALLAGFAAALTAGGCATTEKTTDKTPAVQTPAAKPLSEEEAKRQARELENARQKELAAAVRELDKKNTEGKITGTLELMKKPEYAAPRHQDWLAEKVIEFCRAGDQWNFESEYPDREFPRIVEQILKNDKVTPRTKCRAVSALAMYQCDFGKFKEAEATARRAIAMFQTPPEDRNALRAHQNAWITLSDVYRLQDRYDEARGILREALKAQPQGFPVITLLRAGGDLAMAFRKLQDAAEFTDQMSVPDRINYYQSKSVDNWARFKSNSIGEMKEKWCKANLKKLASDFVRDPKNKPEERLVAAGCLYGEMDPKTRGEIREIIQDMNAKKTLQFYHYPNIITLFQMGDFKMTAEICGFFEGTSFMDNLKNQKIHVISLGALGRKAEAADLAARYGADPKLTPVDKMRFRFYENILRGKSTDGLLKDSGLSRAEQADVLLSAARQCLTWNMSELSMKYAAEYDTYFQKKEQHTLNVKFFAEPVSSIAAWRKIRPRLETKLCNIPFKADMDLLVTDVVTGRSVHIEKDEKIKNFMEVTALCDVDGLHIFLAVKDDNARKIERGFARGMGTEMYFAPGFNQPYNCFGTNPLKGLTFLWNSTYDNRNQRRLNDKDPVRSFRCETEFTDTDYVHHLFFAWDNFYMKLPNAGTEYLFECIAWTPAGGFSWGGTRGIHGVSDFGRLKFELTGPQLNAIRRNLIYRHYKSWKTYHKKPVATVNYFTLWADPEVGDPDFYQKVLVPLEKELDSYAAMVKEDMTDAEVAEIYTKALPRWIGLRDEIDLLRKQYLQDRMLKD